jgi:membrane protein YqaA with SNARE-associated domain
VGFFSSIFEWFLSPAGVLLLAALDSSIVFFLPTALDMAVILVSARGEHGYILIPLLAAAGSVSGAAITYTIGRKGGDAGLERWVSPARLERVRERLGEKGLIAVALAAVIPPPFPLTPFVLTAGAIDMDRNRFLAVLAGARLVRFSAEAALARVFGGRLVAVMESGTFHLIIGGLMIVAIGGTVLTIVKVARRA